MKVLPCLGEFDYEGDFDCGYGTCLSCGDCVCNGGPFDPRYDEDKQPYKLSKFIIHTMNINQDRIDKELATGKKSTATNKRLAKRKLQRIAKR